MNEAERAEVAEMIRVAIREERNAHIAYVRVIAELFQEQAEKSQDERIKETTALIATAFSAYVTALEQRNTVPFREIDDDPIT